MHKFSQDHLELFFNAICVTSSKNNTPTTKQFNALIEELKIHEGMYHHHHHYQDHHHHHHQFHVLIVHAHQTATHPFLGEKSETHPCEAFWKLHPPLNLGGIKLKMYTNNIVQKILFLDLIS